MRTAPASFGARLARCVFGLIVCGFGIAFIVADWRRGSLAARSTVVGLLKWVLRPASLRFRPFWSS